MSGEYTHTSWCTEAVRTSSIPNYALRGTLEETHDRPEDEDCSGVLLGIAPTPSDNGHLALHEYSVGKSHEQVQVSKRHTHRFFVLLQAFRRHACRVLALETWF